MGAYEISLVAIVSINVMLALGLNLITGFCGQVSLGHAAFFGTGAYAAALLAGAGVPLFAVLAPAGIAASLLGLLVGFASLRVRADFLAITTMGVGFVFVGVVRKQPWLGAEMGLTDIPDHGLGDVGFVGLCLVLALAMAALTAHIKRSWLGFAFAAVADDEDTARTLGIDTTLYKLAAFVLGTFLAGVAGAVYAYFTRFIIPGAFGFTVSISILAMVIVGGVGSTVGRDRGGGGPDPAAGVQPRHQRLQAPRLRRADRSDDAFRAGRAGRNRRAPERVSPEGSHAMDALLTVDQIVVRFDGVTALAGVSFVLKSR